LEANVPAILPVEKADPARFDAWLNLSAREKAREFMMVRTSAMTISSKKEIRKS